MDLPVPLTMVEEVALFLKNVKDKEKERDLNETIARLARENYDRERDKDGRKRKPNCYL